MSVLVYTESWEGNFRKSTYEAVSYAYELAQLFNTKVVALSIGKVDEEMLKTLGDYGVTKVFSCVDVEKADNQTIVSVFDQLIDDCSTIIFSNTYSAKMIAPRLSARFKCGLINNVISLPNNISPITVSRKAFSSKAIQNVEVKTDKVILAIEPNSHKLIEHKQEILIQHIDAVKKGHISVKEQEKSSGKVSLSEAEVIVSAGRGLKGPENWNMIEELADLLGAATACSKPVSDIGWRPHSEHVGQTGKAVSPNLYIAVGISGAIQHLAGVNSSKVMVVINTDSEAPFFKAADYGIVGDAFEVVPKLIEEIKKLDS